VNTVGDANPHPNLEHYYDRDTDRLAIDAHLATCVTCRASLAEIHERLRDLECRELVELVTEYLDEAAGDPLRSRIEDHLRLCEGCRSYVEQIESTIATLGRSVPAPEPPEPVRASLLAVFRAWRNGRPAKPE
jgi:predicted anti-sigma-YlaC factor YlaD